MWNIGDPFWRFSVSTNIYDVVNDTNYWSTDKLLDLLKKSSTSNFSVLVSANHQIMYVVPKSQCLIIITFSVLCYVPFVLK